MATLADVIKKYGSMENFKAQTAQPTPAPVQPVQMPVQNVGVAQTTTQAPVQATLPQQPTVAPSVSSVSNPNKEWTLAYNIWEKNNTAKAAPATPVATQASVDNSVVFGQQASDKQALDTTYLDRRNDTIAQQTIDQLNSIANQGQKVDATTRDSIMEGLIAKAGWQVQWDNPDRQNTIDQIYTKVLQQTGSKDWNTAFSTINKPYSQITQYTNGESLWKALDSGLVSASQLENIKKYNPQVYNEYIAKRDADSNLALVNLSKPTASTLVADKGIDVSQLFQSLGLDMTKSADIDLVAKRQELYSTGEVKAAQEAYLKDKKELETLQDTYMNIEDDVRKEYEGTGVTESFIMAKVANRQKPIYKQMQTQQRNYSNSLEAMQLAMWNAKDELDIYAQQATLDRQETMDKLQVGQFAYSIMADQQAREDKFKLADIQFQQEKDMLAYKYDMEYGDINSSDPRVQQRYFDRISEDFVKQYEWLVKSTPQQLAARIKADVQSGKTIEQAMGAIMEDLKKNENYGAYIKKKAWVDDKPEEIGDFIYKKNSNGEWVNMGSKYGVASTVSTGTASSTWSQYWTTATEITRNFIAAKEWFRENAYQDSAWVWTIGYWFTSLNGKAIQPWQVISKEQADVEFDKKLWEYQTWRKYVKTDLSAQQQAALTSFEYNLWKWIWSKSAMNILNAVNNGDFSTAWQMMQAYNKAGWKVLNWLVKRRGEEAAMLLQTTSIASGAVPTAAELMWFNSWTIAQKAWQDGISQQRYNEIDSYMKANRSTTANGLSQNANAILMWFSITDYPVGDRPAITTELTNYFTSVKDTFADQDEWMINKSAIYTKDPNEALQTKLDAIATVKFQLENLESDLNSKDTWPLMELWEKKADKWTDQDTTALRQQMEAILPSLARWVFWEKWVLTDTDIERYRKTIPNLWNKKEVNKAIAQNLREILYNTFKSSVVAAAKNNVNVYNRSKDYVEFRNIAWWTPSKPKPSSRSSAFSGSATTSPLQSVNNSIAGYLNAMWY